MLRLLDTLPRRGKACVYFVVRDSEVIYIGKTDNIKRRVSQHARKQPQRIYIAQCFSVDHAQTLEKRMIWLFAPRLNRDSEKLTSDLAGVKELESWGLDCVALQLVRGFVRVTDVFQYGVCHR